MHLIAQVFLTSNPTVTHNIRKSDSTVVKCQIHFKIHPQPTLNWWTVYNAFIYEVSITNYQHLFGNYFEATHTHCPGHVSGCAWAQPNLLLHWGISVAVLFVYNSSAAVFIADILTPHNKEHTGVTRWLQCKLWQCDSEPVWTSPHHRHLGNRVMISLWLLPHWTVKSSTGFLPSSVEPKGSWLC